MSKNQPIIIKRVSPTLFEIHCKNEVGGDITESLLKRICQFPAEFKRMEENISVSDEDVE